MNINQIEELSHVQHEALKHLTRSPFPFAVLKDTIDAHDYVSGRDDTVIHFRFKGSNDYNHCRIEWCWKRNKATDERMPYNPYIIQYQVKLAWDDDKYATVKDVLEYGSVSDLKPWFEMVTGLSLTDQREFDGKHVKYH